jgi:hypothetical protein
MKRLNLSMLTAICLLVSHSLFAQRNPTLSFQPEGPPFSQNITFDAPGNYLINDGGFTVSAWSSSGLDLYFEVSDPSVVSWTGGNNFQINGAGTCSITARQDGNEEYFPASPQEQSVTISKLNNEVHFDALPTATYTDLPYSISSYAGASSGVYNFTTSDPEIAYVTDEGSNLLVINHAGTVTITANFPETETYNSAESISYEITINKADHMVHYFEPMGTRTYGDAPFQVVAASTSGETVVFESSNPEIASVEGTTVTIHSGGTVSIIAGVPESADYNTATPYEQSLTIDRINQSISFDPLPPVYLGDSPFALTASASSGLLVTFASDNPSVAGIDESGVVTISYYGLVTIQASQPGNENYNAAEDVYQQLMVYYPKPTQNTYGLEVSPSDVRSLSVAYTPGDGGGRLLVMKENAPVNFIPEVNTFYSPGQNINGNVVISAEYSSSALLESLHDGSTYYFAVYEFNSDGAGAITYRTEDAPTASYLIPALGPAYVTTPVNNAINQKITSVTVTSVAVYKATSYTIELNTSPDFSGVGFIKSGSRSQVFTGLAYNTQYFSRVKTNLSPYYGEIKTFTTAPAEFYAYVTSPANNATGVGVRVSVASNTVLGATSYEIELNTSPNFDGTSFVKSGTSRGQLFTGLAYNTVYYSRVRTSLSAVWGVTKSFRTLAASPYVISPVNNAIDVPWQVTVKSSTISGATSYTIQLSPLESFTSGVIEVTASTPMLNFSGLAYSTRYYSRVTSDVSPGVYGPVKSFVTGSPLVRTVVTNPANHAVNVVLNPFVSSTTIAGATLFTIELNTDPGFSPVSAIVLTGATRSIRFRNLLTNTTYYTRMQTNLLPGVWGASTSFTTTSGVVGRLRTHDKMDTEDLTTAVEFGVEVKSNPFRNKLSFVVYNPTMEDAKVVLLDLNGKPVHESIERTNTPIDIEKQISNGIYILHIRTRDNYKAVRVVRMD